MPEKWAAFARGMSPLAAGLTRLPRFYVASFFEFGEVPPLWIASTAVQRLAR